ncbi:MAG: hypothetical protein ACLSG9_10680 [Eubacterium sp.]
MFNNHALAWYAQWQTLFYGKRYSQTRFWKIRWITVK